MMKQAPLASILIPVYNAERYVCASLDSALAQTHPNCEIIAIDDGSTDGSAEVLRQYEGRIRWWSQENSGQAICRNRLLAASSGEYLEFLDADDILHPKKIATQIATLEANPGVGLALGAMRLFYKGIDEEGKLYPNPVGVDPWLALIKMWYTFTSAGLWRRSCFESIGGWQEGIVSGHEYSRYFEVLRRNSPIIFTDEPHTWYRMPSREKPNLRPQMTTLTELLKRLETIENYLKAKGCLTREHRRAISERRLDIARKMWGVDHEASGQVAHDIPAGDIGFTSDLPNLPGRFLLLYKFVGFETAQRLSAIRRLAETSRGASAQT